MPAPPPVLYPTNALEGAVLTLGPDGAVAGRGVARLVDRDLGLECEDVGTAGVRTWTADLGVGAVPAVAAWIVRGTELPGEPLTLESSADGTSWTTRATVSPLDSTPARATFAAVTARYWRWSITDPPAPIRLTEVWLSAPMMFRFKPAAPFLREPLIPNVLLVESASGRAWGIQRGARRWSATYTMTYAPNTDRPVLFALLDALADGAKPFWLLTVEGELRWVRLSGAVDLQNADRTASAWDIPLRFTEELP